MENMKKETLLVAVAIVLSCGIRRSNAITSNKYTRLEEKRIPVANIIRTVKTASRMMCSALCSQTDGCKAVNVEQKEHGITCDLTTGVDYQNELTDNTKSNVFFKPNDDCNNGFCLNGAQCDQLLMKAVCSCTGNFAGERCHACAPGWAEPNCNTCVQGWGGPNCDECAQGWAGSNCDSCAQGWDGPDCGECAPRWRGNNCDRCAVGWDGPNCDTCDTGFTGSNCDTCTAGLTGPNCDQCAAGFYGPNCDVTFTELAAKNCNNNISLQGHIPSSAATDYESCKVGCGARSDCQGFTTWGNLCFYKDFTCENDIHDKPGGSLYIKD